MVYLKERLETMKIVNRKISGLIHPDYNPRQISEKAFNDLKASLNEFDAVEPAVINIHPKRKDIIIGGNQRIRAAEALGRDSFPCYEIELSPAKEKELNVRLNKNTGEWDWALLNDNFDKSDLLDWGFDKGDFLKEKETKDFSDEIGMSEFQIIIKCESEEKQQSIYKQLCELNIKCDLLSI